VFGFAFYGNLKMFIDTLNETLNKSIVIADCLLLIMIYNVFIVLHNTGVFFVWDHGRISLDFKRHCKSIYILYININLYLIIINRTIKSI